MLRHLRMVEHILRIYTYIYNIYIYYTYMGGYILRTCYWMQVSMCSSWLLRVRAGLISGPFRMLISFEHKSFHYMV